MKKKLVLVCMAFAALTLFTTGCDSKLSKGTPKETLTPAVPEGLEDASLETDDAVEYAKAIQNIIADKDLYAFAEQCTYPITLTYTNQTVGNVNEMKALDATEVINDSFAIDVFETTAEEVKEENGVYTLGTEERYVSFKWIESESKFSIIKIANAK